MKAMRFQAPGPVEGAPLGLVDLPRPDPGQGEIRLRATVCGVCHTDLHTVEGELSLPRLPLVPGHQVVGLVEARGPGAMRFREGDRVGVPWLYQTCGACAFCRRGEENLCDRARFTGYHVDGGYAEALVVHEAFAYRLPEQLPDPLAAPLLCAGIIGYRALRLSEVKPGERLGLFGFGASAHIALQIARHWKCEVLVFTRSPAHQALARKLGAVWVGSASDAPPEPIDRAILFAPAGRLVHNALRVLRKGGTLAIAAIYLDPIPELDYGALLYGERTVRSVTASTRRDGEELLALAPEIPIRTEVESFPLEAANEALLRLKRSEIRGAGVLRLA
ncbi:MAG: zinc-dependent alcohol dehydrogenase family protein [Candidatus Rokubacteria bacterium]|nr:zinc-dependent alcohol dehydrogenase family protein [Candidatus Rokubacteria bacterium]